MDRSGMPRHTALTQTVSISYGAKSREIGAHGLACRGGATVSPTGRLGRFSGELAYSRKHFRNPVFPENPRGKTMGQKLKARRLAGLLRIFEDPIDVGGLMSFEVVDVAGAPSFDPPDPPGRDNAFVLRPGCNEVVDLMFCHGGGPANRQRQTRRRTGSRTPGTPTARVAARTRAFQLPSSVAKMAASKKPAMPPVKQPAMKYATQIMAVTLSGASCGTPRAIRRPSLR